MNTDTTKTEYTANIDRGEGDEIVCEGAHRYSSHGGYRRTIYVGRDGFPRSFELCREINLAASEDEMIAAIDEVAAQLLADHKRACEEAAE